MPLALLSLGRRPMGRTLTKRAEVYPHVANVASVIADVVFVIITVVGLESLEEEEEEEILLLRTTPSSGEGGPPLCSLPSPKKGTASEPPSPEFKS